MGVPCSTHNNRGMPDGDEDGDRSSESDADDSRSSSSSSTTSSCELPALSSAPRAIDVPQQGEGAVADTHRDGVTGGPQNAMAVVANAVSLRQERRHLRQQQRDREEKQRAQRRATNSDDDGQVRDAALYQAMLQQALERARLHQMLRQQREQHGTTKAVLAVPPATASGGASAAKNETERVAPSGREPDDGPLGQYTKGPKGDLHSSTDDGGGGNPSSTATTSAVATNPFNPSSNDMVALAGLASAEPGTSTSSGESRSPASEVSPPPFTNSGPRRPAPWHADERRSRTPHDSGYAAGAGSTSTPSEYHPRNADRPTGADAFGAASDTVTSSRDHPSGRLEKSVASTSSYT